MITVSNVQKTVDIHDLDHVEKKIDYLVINPEDAKRRRFRAMTLSGIAINISIARDETLKDGSVLHETETHYIVLRIKSSTRLHLKPRTLNAAIQIGFLAGHLHWKTNIVHDVIRVDVDGDVADYQVRLDDYLDQTDYQIKIETDGDE